MKLFCLALILTLCGCETMQRHPVITAVIAGSIAATAVASGHGHSRTDSHDVHVPGNPCTTPEACR